MNDILNLLWANNTAMGRIIIVLIVIFGVAGGLSAMKHRRRYLARERQWLDAVRDRLRRAQDVRQLPATTSDEGMEGASEDAAAPPPQPMASGVLIELAELMEGIPSDTLIGDRLVSIVRMKQARAKVNIDALQQSTMLKESANSGLTFPAYVVSLVMMLGLFGTFVGLSMMVVDIQQALPGGDGAANATQWAASVSGLGKILAGKKTAFSATLAGLFFSIVVSALNFRLARAQSAFYDALERFTTEELLPATVPAFDDETPWEKLSTQLGDSFDHLKTVAAEQSRSADQLVAVEKTFATVIDNIEAITQRAATAPLQGMTGEISSVIGHLTQVNAAVISMTEKLPQVIAAFRQTHQSALADIHSAMQGQQAAVERLARSMQGGEGRSRYANVSLVAAGATAMLLIVFFFVSRG
ncbi:MAG: hypothetical protein QOI58_1658 [Thermoanaerobaculia bacterium]|jgi:hypothetical protein|nr:hypothetical protein [Thermoanaerobaculia bacterium]